MTSKGPFQPKACYDSVILIPIHPSELHFFLISKDQPTQIFKWLPQISATQISPAFFDQRSDTWGHFSPPLQHTSRSLFSAGLSKCTPLHSLPYRSLLDVLTLLVSPHVMYSSILHLQRSTGWAVFLFLACPFTFTTFLCCMPINYCLKQYIYPLRLHPFPTAGWDISWSRHCTK